MGNKEREAQGREPAHPSSGKESQDAVKPPAPLRGPREIPPRTPGDDPPTFGDEGGGP